MSCIVKLLALLFSVFVAGPHRTLRMTFTTATHTPVLHSARPSFFRRIGSGSHANLFLSSCVFPTTGHPLIRVSWQAHTFLVLHRVDITSDLELSLSLEIQVRAYRPLKRFARSSGRDHMPRLKLVLRLQSRPAKPYQAGIGGGG